jgi:DNA-binding NtrC family response regulator
MRVLLVDDDPLILFSAAEHLRDEGFEVIEALTGDEALALFPHNLPVQVLLTDIRMPGSVDGWELARRVRGRDPHVVVIYVTGYSDLPASPVSGSLFFNKPYRMERIVEAICALTEHPKISAGLPRDAD